MNNKFPKLAAFMGIAVINIHTGLFGQKSHARLDEEQLQKLEDHMATEGGDEQMQVKLDELQKKYDALNSSHTTLQSNNTVLQTAVTAALELNGLTAEVTAETTPAQAVELLGTKCKEYGSSQNRHAFPNNDGSQQDDEDPSKHYAHNNVMADKSKFKTIV